MQESLIQVIFSDVVLVVESCSQEFRHIDLSVAIKINAFEENFNFPWSQGIFEGIAKHFEINERVLLCKQLLVVSLVLLDSIVMIPVCDKHQDGFLEL